MKIGMKEDMGVANEMTLLNLVSCTHSSLTNCARSVPKHTNWQFIVLEGKDFDESAHEGGQGRYQ